MLRRPGHDRRAWSAGWHRLPLLRRAGPTLRRPRRCGRRPLRRPGRPRLRVPRRPGDRRGRGAATRRGEARADRHLRPGPELPARRRWVLTLGRGRRLPPVGGSGPTPLVGRGNHAGRPIPRGLVTRRRRATLRVARVLPSLRRRLRGLPVLRVGPLTLRVGPLVRRVGPLTLRIGPIAMRVSPLVRRVSPLVPRAGRPRPRSRARPRDGCRPRRRRLGCLVNRRRRLGCLVNRSMHSLPASRIARIALTWGLRLPLPGDLVDPGGLVAPAVVASLGAPAVHRAPRYRPGDWQRSVTVKSTSSLRKCAVAVRRPG